MNNNNYDENGELLPVEVQIKQHIARDIELLPLLTNPKQIKYITERIEEMKVKLAEEQAKNNQ